MGLYNIGAPLHSERQGLAAHFVYSSSDCDFSFDFRLRPSSFTPCGGVSITATPLKCGLDLLLLNPCLVMYFEWYTSLVEHAAWLNNIKFLN